MRSKRAPRPKPVGMYPTWHTELREEWVPMVDTPNRYEDPYTLAFADSDDLPEPQAIYIDWMGTR